MYSWPRLWRQWGDNELLWGQLDIEPASGGDLPGCHARVQSWLAARRAALGRLHLHTYSAAPGDSDALVSTLAGSTVSELDWKMGALGTGSRPPPGAAALHTGPLALPRLRSLELEAYSVEFGAALAGCTALATVHVRTGAVTGLANLPAAALRELQLIVDKAAGGQLALLSRATRLTRLAFTPHNGEGDDVRAVVATVAALPALVSLMLYNDEARFEPVDLRPVGALSATLQDISWSLGCRELGVHGAAARHDWAAPLGQLTQLTALWLEAPLSHSAAGPLPCLPMQLTGLAGLRQLRVDNAELCTSHGAASLEALSSLMALTSLTLCRCSVQQGLPRQLSQLTALEVLDLHQTVVRASSDAGLTRGSWEAGGLACVAGMTSLTSICLFHSVLERVPEALGRLPGLRELDLTGMYRTLEQSDSERFGALAGCSALSSLKLSTCGLPTIPAFLATLPALAHLELDGNPLQATDGLGALGALSHLSIACGRLGRAPPELAALLRLEVSALGMRQLAALLDWGPQSACRRGNPARHARCSCSLAGRRRHRRQLSARVQLAD
jgi:hypothetical protein